jgi:AcrR family transcriptional regulator
VASRAEQKARTRNALIHSWLRLIGDGANFASVSLREVAKTAGVVPTSFYRHFGDMDELGLAVVDQLGSDLRRLGRLSRDPDTPVSTSVQQGVAAFAEYVTENADLVRFVNQARTGGNSPLRKAIDNELEFFSARIASVLGDVRPELDTAARDLVAELVIAVLLESTPAMLEADAEQLVEAQSGLEQKIHVVLLGAAQLADDSQPPKPRKRAPARATGGRDAKATSAKKATTKSTAARKSTKGARKPAGGPA